VQHRKRKATKKPKKKNSNHRSKKSMDEGLHYQPDNPLTIYYAKYINSDGKV
tara:strand:- start:1763 stop:1918 length:156 start_codon:yes stop_codon:yes gene_type:complete